MADEAPVAPMARAMKLVSWMVTGVFALGVVRLAWAFARSDMTFTVVAEQSRRSSHWVYRVAGMWGSAEGSLWFFAAVVTGVAAWCLRRLRSAWPHGVIAVTGLGFGVVCLSAANPFSRLAVPAVDGRGLTPILEHPAMAAHPPLLYVGFGLLLAAAVNPSPRRSLLSAVAALTAAMTLGGAWSYAEQGWGGYWAWDPVENTSLIPWLVALTALHLGERAPRWLVSLPWILVMWGGVLTRSGTATSVHAFASAKAVTWGLTALASAASFALGFGALRRARRVDDSYSPGSQFSGDRFASATSGGARTTAALLIGLLGGVVLIGTAVPAFAELFGRPIAVRGSYFARLTAPFALAALVALAWFAISGVRRRTIPLSAWIAHIGFALLLLGVFATAFDSSYEVPVSAGETVHVGRFTVYNAGVSVRPGPHPETNEVIATMSVNGHTMRPSLVAYPERGGRLAETAVHTRPWADYQVTLLDADDHGTIVVEVRWRPLMQLVWLGAAVLCVGASLSWCRLLRLGRSCVDASPPADR